MWRDRCQENNANEKKNDVLTYCRPRRVRDSERERGFGFQFNGPRRYTTVSILIISQRRVNTTYRDSAIIYARGKKNSK